jgi:hypothetical protein
LVGISALLLPSMMAAGYFIISYFLMNSMLNKMEKRIKASYIILIIKSVAVFGCLVWKFQVLHELDNKSVFPTTLKHFKKDVYFYESLGFDLIYDKSLLNNETAVSYNFGYNGFSSFALEILMVFMITCYIFYLRKL